jgi:hypothetical protein
MCSKCIFHPYSIYGFNIVLRLSNNRFSTVYQITSYIQVVYVLVNSNNMLNTLNNDTDQSPS